MNEPVISIRGIGKQYKLGETLRHDTLRDAIADKASRLFGRAPKAKQADPARPTEFWALKDVNFDVHQGDVIGIIGRNGAGKSTLLKVLSQITEPTTGEIRVRGRIASLLEVGTGFHPELTGRENIFLNGAILGMTRVEIRRKFDEIVAFAGVEKFLDTPVKRFSSGMYVRLAFAVAAHLEPEILVIDEVLAVGDAAFQKKCLGHMDRLSRDGRTVLFVSHTMSAISRLCTRAVLMDRGSVSFIGDVSEAVARYLDDGNQIGEYPVDLRDFTDRSGDGAAKVTTGSVEDAAGRPCSVFSVGDDITVRFTVQYGDPDLTFSHSIEVVNSEGVPIYHLWDADDNTPLEAVARREVVVTLPNVSLYPDMYYITLWVGGPSGARSDRVSNCLRFVLEQNLPDLARPLNRVKGLVHIRGLWSHRDFMEGSAIGVSSED